MNNFKNNECQNLIYILHSYGMSHKEKVWFWSTTMDRVIRTNKKCWSAEPFAIPLADSFGR